MNVAITGATGFIGNELLIKHLELGDTVRILTRKNKSIIQFPENVRIYNGDLISESVHLNDFVQEVDVLYHCAAEIKDESKMYETNVIGTQNLVNAAYGKIKHWVQLSSTGVYGNPSKGIITELTAVDPKNTYEVTKLKSDEIIINAGNQKKLTYTILRPSNVYGINMKNQSLFQLIKAIDNGFFFFIGKKGAYANYISVENVISAMILCGKSQNARDKTFILSDQVTLEKFIFLISEQLNKPFPKLRLPRLIVDRFAKLGDIISKIPLTTARVSALTNRSFYCSDLIINDLHYSHCVTMEEGIKRLVSYYRNSN